MGEAWVPLTADFSNVKQGYCKVSEIRYVGLFLREKACRDLTFHIALTLLLR